MKTLNDLTEEIKNTIPHYKRKAKNFYNGIPFKREVNTEYIEKVYELGKKDKPVIIFADNPEEYKILFEMIFSDSRNIKLINLLFKLKNEK